MDRMGKKYLIIRRDGSIPRWPAFVLAGADPAAAVALRAYADEAERLGMASHYVRGVRDLADEFDLHRQFGGEGNPGEPDHRVACELVHRLLQGGDAPAPDPIRPEILGSFAVVHPLDRVLTRRDVLNLVLATEDDGTEMLMSDVLTAIWQEEDEGERVPS